MEGIPKVQGLYTESIEKFYLVPFINDDYEYDESLKPEKALEKYFSWAQIKPGDIKGEFYLESRGDLTKIIEALKTIQKIL